MNDKQVAVAVLGVVNSLLDRDAVIAGGYVRDLALGRETKDVDIWYHPDQWAKSNTNMLLPVDFDAMSVYLGVSSILRQAGFKVSNATLLNYYEEDPAMNWCHSLTKFTVNGVNIDLIHCKQPIGRDPEEGLFHQFDFGICMAAIRGTTFYVCDKFEQDVKNKTITFYDTSRGEEDMDRVINSHLPRIRAKFPDYKVKGLEAYGIE